MLDLTASGLALLLLSPFAVLLAIAIRLEDRGPVLYWQKRVGLRGHVFDFPKFRSMRTDSDEIRKKLEQLKPHVLVWWNSGAQSAQVLKDGEVDMVSAWNGRIQAIQSEPEGKAGKIGVTFDEQILVSDCWLIPKGAPNKELALKAIQIMMRPEVNARI